MNIENYTLEEIIALNNKRLYIEYLSELESLKTTRLARKVVLNNKGKSLEDIYSKIEEEETKNTSTILFPGDIILLYGGIRELESKTKKTCSFSGTIIRPGQYYINYRPLIDNITTNNCYVLKRSLQVETGYSEDLPTSITELEDLIINVKSECDSLDGISYSHLSSTPEGEIALQKLKKKSTK